MESVFRKYIYKINFLEVYIYLRIYIHIDIQTHKYLRKTNKLSKKDSKWLQNYTTIFQTAVKDVATVYCSNTNYKQVCTVHTQSNPYYRVTIEHYMFHTRYIYHTTSVFSRAPSEQKYVTSNFSYYMVKAFNKPTTENDQTCACNAYLVHSSSCYWPAKWIQPDIHRAMKLLHLAAIWYMGWICSLRPIHEHTHTHTHYCINNQLDATIEIY